MPQVLPIQPGSFMLGSQIAPKNYLNGTHFSHLGIGGFVELPTLQYMYDIPCGQIMNADGLSSGRRKLGMVVYVLSENKFFQLKPRKNNLEYVSFSEWAAAESAQKMVWLDPLASRDSADFSSIFTGTGNASDAWTEVFIEKGWEETAYNLGSNTVNLYPRRNLYYIADNQANIPSVPADLTSLVGNNNLIDGSVFGIQVQTDTKRIIIAYPSAYGELTRVIDSSTAFNITNSFAKKTISNVGSENDIYFVYYLTLAANYSFPVIYVVTI